MGDATGGRGEELRLAGGFTPPVSAGGCSSSGLSSPARMHACAQSGDTSLAAGFQCRYVVDVVNTCVTRGSFTSLATAPPLSVILSPRMPRRVLLTSGAKYATTGEKNRFGSPGLAAAAGGSRSGFTDAAPPSTPRLDAAATISASLRYGDLEDSYKCGSIPYNIAINIDMWDGPHAKRFGEHGNISLQDKLMEMNDDGKTFGEIADWIEINVEVDDV